MHPAHLLCAHVLCAAVAAPLFTSLAGPAIPLWPRHRLLLHQAPQAAGGRVSVPQHRHGQCGRPHHPGTVGLGTQDNARKPTPKNKAESNMDPQKKKNSSQHRKRQKEMKHFEVFQVWCTTIAKAMLFRIL